MDKPNTADSTRRPPAPAGIAVGFTLVELLVVIGIIALLVGILLPVLGKARQAAYAAKCAANMKTAATALIFYTNQYKGWLPGPHTSGKIWPSGSPPMTLTDVGLDGDRTPTQNMDWMSPTLGAIMDLPVNDFQRLAAFYTSQLYCPSNMLNFNDVFPAGGPITQIDFPYQSYSAVIHFHSWPAPTGTNDVAAPHTISLTAAPIVFPKGYAPKITRIGKPAAKVYLVEGARYVGSGKISFNNLRYQIQGGNFMIAAPIKAQPDTPYDLPTDGTGNFTGKPSPSNVNYAWRHGGKMNLAFFDGHVELRDAAETVNWALYFPPGARMGGMAKDTFDKYDSYNQIRD